MPVASLEQPTKLATEYLEDTLKLDKKEIPILQKKLRILFILDGYDEWQEKWQKKNLYKENKLGEWERSKVLITCRTTHLKKNASTLFDDEEEYPEIVQELTFRSLPLYAMRGKEVQKEYLFWHSTLQIFLANKYITDNF